MFSRLALPVAVVLLVLVVLAIVGCGGGSSSPPPPPPPPPVVVAPKFLLQTAPVGSPAWTAATITANAASVTAGNQIKVTVDSGAVQSLVLTNVYYEINEPYTAGTELYEPAGDWVFNGSILKEGKTYPLTLTVTMELP